MSWLLGPSYADIVNKHEGDNECDRVFLEQVAVTCGHLLYPFRSALPEIELRSISIEMAKVALLQFRKFGRVEGQELWRSVYSSLRNSLVLELDAHDFPSLKHAENTRRVLEAMEVLSVDGGISIRRMADYLGTEDGVEVQYYVELAAETELFLFLKKIKDFYTGEDKYRLLERSLVKLSERQMRFLSLVVESGADCQSAGNALSLSEFEVIGLVRNASNRVFGA